MTDRPPKTDDSASAREKALAQALRANLRRRKAAPPPPAGGPDKDNPAAD